jgi:hypothetical protein
MEVIRHQAESMCLHAVSVTRGSEQLCELDPITVVEEDVASSSSPVHHVMPAILSKASKSPCHLGSLRAGV